MEDSIEVCSSGSDSSGMNFPHEKTKKRKELEEENSSAVQRKRPAIDKAKQKEGERATDIGEEAIQEGELVIESGEEATQDADQVIESGEKATQDADQVIESGEEATKNAEQAIQSGEEYDYDLFVIGAGSGGVRASRTSADYGAKVAICELPFHPISSETVGGVGGTCVIRGCVPKKILVYGASFASEFEDAQNYGWELNEKPNYNWEKLLENKTQEIVRLNKIYKKLLSKAGVEMYEGEGKLVGPHEVELTQIDGTKLNFSAKHILVATGGRAQRPNIPGKELGITSDEALSLDELPKRVVVLGGGYIDVEFASIWRGMGSTVDFFFRKELPLRGFDDEMRELVAQNLEGRESICTQLKTLPS